MCVYKHAHCGEQRCGDNLNEPQVALSFFDAGEIVSRRLPNPNHRNHELGNQRLHIGRREVGLGVEGRYYGDGGWRLTRGDGCCGECVFRGELWGDEGLG